MINLGENFNIDLDKLISTRMLIQANSGGGKSYAIRKLLEETHGKVQQIVIDLEGEFASLRENYDYLLVGPDGEIPASIQTAEILAKKLMKLKVSTIIDLSELKHHERILFVKRFLDAMVNLPRTLDGVLLWHSCLVIIDEAHQFCLSEDTEILTKSGWKRYDKIRVGEMVVSFNNINNKYELKPIKDILIREHEGNLNHLYNEDSIDCLVTGDHRVLCSTRTTSKNRESKWTDLKFVQSKDLPTGFKVPITSTIYGNGINIDDDLLKILGWIITDGNLNNKKAKNKAYEITQSKYKRDSISENMKKTIKNRFANSSCYNLKARKNTKEAYCFYINTKDSKEIENYLGDCTHRIPRIILENCTKNQLKVLFDAIVDGDGTIQKSKNGFNSIIFYPGYNDHLADEFQELSIRLGYSAIKKKVKANGQTVVKVSLRRKFASVRKVKKEFYSGIVWDITIDNGAFLCRRNGKPFITGNCPEKSKSESGSSVIDLCTRGRKRGYCAVLATQRISKLNKDAAAECNNQMVGRTLLDIDQKRAADTLGMTDKQEIRNLRNMDDGQFRVFGPAIGRDVKNVQVGLTKTVHLDIRQNISKPSPTPENIKKLLKDVIDLPKEVEEELKTTKDFKNKIRELKTKLTMAEKQKPIIRHESDGKQLKEMERESGIKIKKIENHYLSLLKQSESNRSILEGKILDIGKILDKKVMFQKSEQKLTKYVPEVRTKEITQVINQVKPQVTPSISINTQDGEIALGLCEKKLYSLLCEYSERSFSKQQIGVFTGYSYKSGGFSNAISRLKQLELIRGSGNDLQVNEINNDIIGQFDFSKEAIISKLGKCEKEIYVVLINNEEEEFTREELAERTDTQYSSTSGGFSNAISRLRTLGILLRDNGVIKLNPEVMELG